MNRLLLFLLFLSGAATLSPLSAQSSSPSLRDLDALTARWIALRGTLAEEQRQWRNRKNAWEQEIDLRQEEAAALETELDATREELSSTEERQSDLLARRQELETSLQSMDRTLDRASGRVRELANLLPPPLFDELSADLRAIARESSPPPPRAERAQRLVAFLSAVESMQNRTHAVSETLEVEGTRRQVDVLYLGLARGFAVSPRNDWAAVGTPGPEGWTWTPGSVDPDRVRKLVDIHQQRETATLVPLPLAVEETP